MNELQAGLAKAANRTVEDRIRSSQLVVGQCAAQLVAGQRAAQLPAGQRAAQLVAGECATHLVTSQHCA